MRRTQIYLTDDQTRLIGEIARQDAISKAEAIRRILDRALGVDAAEPDDRATIQASAGLLADYPDWPEWLEDVRGGSADERPRSLGL